MDRTKLKDIIRTLEITLDTLKAEVYSDVDSYKSDEKISTKQLDYDELFDDGLCNEESVNIDNMFVVRL